ncbi:cytochrome d ubiquinol oxidase subunit II [Streptomyces noursei]|uniref:Cytochrome C oxidase assembly protein n=1 Tax=Streptomyces noursei TaxID=1971 RepID=A0A2N8PGJ6_STRNR|nr:cytochrome d ubiquinol oxidase subunit II [Streptomyces noursei]PNE40121.1 cytochrome C oxidase assembly protein [Streptomyces noursei]
MQLQLHDVWFVLIAVLWTGYFFLEGFDFGIGILTRVVARNDEERGVLLATIGPVWDGNEVWLLTAVGATFAAFPDWYATMCSGFYLPMLAVVVCLIVRGVALEYRAKREDAAWKRTCDRCVFWSSLVCAPLWGFVFANMVHGVPIGPDRAFTGSLLDLVNPYSLLGSAVTLCLFTFHGALYAALKTSGELRKRSRETARRASGFTVVFVLAFLMWTQKNSGGTSTQVLLAVVAATLILAAELNDTGRDGWAFALSGLTVAAITATLFLALFPAVMPSSLSPTLDLTVANSSASPHTLRILTWVAAFMVPVVIGYQSWTYWIFRKRVDPRRAPAPVRHHETY